MNAMKRIVNLMALAFAAASTVSCMSEIAEPVQEMVKDENLELKELVFSASFEGRESDDDTKTALLGADEILKEGKEAQNLIENLLWTLTSNASNKRNINQTTMGLLFMQLLNHTDKLAYQSKEEAAILQIFKYVEENYKRIIQN